MPITCFLITPTGEASLTLRRYAIRPCPVHGCTHKGVTYIGTAPVEQTTRGTLAELRMPCSDPRWPVRCDCGYVFADDDPRQTNQSPLYRAPDGREYTLRLGDAPPGAMWDAPWFADDWHGPDGRCLTVVLPSGEHWVIDGPSSGNGPGWTRTGEPPHITVQPSIAARRYHGWLQNGVLTDDMEGRTYG